MTSQAENLTGVQAPGHLPPVTERSRGTPFGSGKSTEKEGRTRARHPSGTAGRRSGPTAGPLHARGGRARPAPGHRPDSLPELRAVGHHEPRAPRRARWSEAGPAPHPVHHVARAPGRGCEAPQVRQGRRRRHGKLPPPRRLRDLRRARPHGAVFHDAGAPRRGVGQLRLARRRSGGGDAVHGMPSRADGGRAPRRDRSGYRSLPPELRRHQDGTRRPAGEGSESADQRRVRHRRRHGDEHSAAQPRRGLRGLRAPPRRAPRGKAALFS